MNWEMSIVSMILSLSIYIYMQKSKWVYMSGNWRKKLVEIEREWSIKPSIQYACHTGTRKTGSEMRIEIVYCVWL